MDKVLRAFSPNAFEIDAKQVDIEAIQKALETKANSIVSLYNYLLAKDIIRA